MKIRSKVTIGLLSSAMCVAALAHAGYKKSTDSKDEISFTTKAVGMTIEGSVPKFEYAEEKDGVLMFKANLFDLKTGIAERDKHAIKALKVTNDTKYAVLTVPTSKVVVGKGKTVTGKLKLGGTKEAPVKITYDAVKAGAKVNVSATFIVDIKKQGIAKEDVCRLGVCVADETEVKVKFTMQSS